MDLPEFVKPGRVAEELRVNPKTVTRWAKDGKIKSILTPGKQRRIPKTELESLIRGDHPNQRREPPAGGTARKKAVKVKKTAKKVPPAKQTGGRRRPNDGS